MAGAFELIADQLADPDAQWSLGTFGAIAEFMRDADEPAEIARDAHAISMVTPRGGSSRFRPPAGRRRPAGSSFAS